MVTRLGTCGILGFAALGLAGCAAHEGNDDASSSANADTSGAAICTSQEVATMGSAPVYPNHLAGLFLGDTTITEAERMWCASTALGETVNRTERAS